MMRHLLCAAIGLALAGNSLGATENQVIRISTNHTDLVLQVAENGRTDGCIRHIWVRNYCMNPI